MVSRKGSTASTAGTTPKVIAKSQQTTSAEAERKKTIMASGLSTKIADIKGGRGDRKNHGTEPVREMFPPPPKPAESTRTWAYKLGGLKIAQPATPRPVVPNAPVPQPTAMKSVYGPSVQGSQQAFQSVLGSTVRRTDRVHDYEEYDEGIVFSTAYHETHYDQDRFDEGDINQTISNFGIVSSKFRKSIVISRFPNHVIALPIYTHGGRGLTRKANRDEYVSVRDDDDRDYAAPAESKHETLWAYTDEDFKHSKWHRMGDETSVRFTTPHSHQMTCKATISGRLDEDSIEKLHDLYKQSLFPRKAVTRPRLAVPAPSHGTGEWNTVGSRGGSRVGQNQPSADRYRPSR